MYTKDQIIETLRHVIHPDLGKNMVELNMVDDIVIEGEQVSFSLKFQKPKDPLIPSIRKACFKAIITYLGAEVVIKKINIKVPEQEVAPAKEQPLSGVKNIIAVASGKGGVGKSTISTNLAVALAATGAKVGLIDADIFGPSIPKMFKVEDAKPFVKKVDGNDVITPVENYGVKMLSVGFFVNPDDALIWRGPMATGALKQLIEQGDWGELDYLLIDLPPGTSDIHITLVQTIPVTGAVIVTTPQDVALADAIKGINMFKGKGIEVPVLGLIENMSWFTPEELPDNKYYIFGKDGGKRLADKVGVDLLGQIPIVQSIREGGDEGVPVALNQDSVMGKAFSELAGKVQKEIEKRNKNIDPTQKVEITKK